MENNDVVQARKEQRALDRIEFTEKIYYERINELYGIMHEITGVIIERIDSLKEACDLETRRLRAEIEKEYGE